MRPLRVGLLAYGLERPLTGVTRVALELGRALERRSDCEVTFLTSSLRGPWSTTARTAHLPGCQLLPGMMLLGGPLIARAARRHRLDVVHDPIGIGPFTVGRHLAPFARVLTLHDAIAFQQPGGYPLLNNILHRLYIPSTLRNVDAVGTVSEDAAQALRRHYRLPDGKVRVIPNAVSASFAPPDRGQAAATAAALGVTGRYILYVGALQARKNVPTLLTAFAAARSCLPEHKLVLAGSSPWGNPVVAERIRELDLGNAVVALGAVSERALPGLYSAADAFVLPSLVEGFGIPVLEAMACGTPVICSNASSLPEVASDAALYFDPRRPSEIADGIVRVVQDERLAADLRARGRRRAAQFSWDRSAEEYVALYRDQLARR